LRAARAGDGEAGVFGHHDDVAHQGKYAAKGRTGGGGIGSATCPRFAEEGARVVVCEINPGGSGRLSTGSRPRAATPWAPGMEDLHAINRDVPKPVIAKVRGSPSSATPTIDWADAPLPS
jgi:hypothetical protein